MGDYDIYGRSGVIVDTNGGADALSIREAVDIVHSRIHANQAVRRQAMNSLRTPQAMLSFPDLFTPRPPAQGAEPRYAAAFVFDQEAQQSSEYKALRKAVLECARERWGDRTDDMIRAGQLRMPFRDAGEKEYNGYEAGKTYITPWSKSRPGIVDAQLQEILVADDIWPGQLARATVTPFAYENSGNKGVSFGLNNVQIIKKDMPRLDGRRAAKEDFDAVSGSADEDDYDDEIPF